MKILPIVAFLVALVACSSRAPSTVSRLVSLAPTCAVPNAIPGDGLDDRAAIQAALNAQGCAYLPTGVYDVDSIPFVPPVRRPYMMLSVIGPAQLYGDGPSTVLHFRGTAGGQDWQGIRLAGSGASIHDLAIDTADISVTTEQTHAVHTLGPASGLELYRVRFNHPVRPGERGGDCYQIVGYNDGRLVSDVRVHDNDFTCDRSAVGVHSGVSNLVIEDNRSLSIGNTDYDFEGSGDTHDILITHNEMTVSPGPHGVGSIQLQLVSKARITGNRLSDRGLDVYQSDDVEIDHNTITLTQTTTAPVISVGKDSARTNIHHNTITREASAGAGAVIGAGPHGTGTPDHLTITDNVLTQRTGFHVVSTSGLVGLYVRHNTIIYDDHAAAGMCGVQALGSAGATGIRTTDVVVAHNTFAGLLLTAVGVSGSYAGIGTLNTIGNVTTGPTYGIYCDNVASAGTVQGPIVSTRDSWPAPLCGLAGFVGVSP